ncbi:MAG: decaprenyl-phosphate phosphoribosyltransferase [Halomonadaceae bacterium]|nr:MAG: decaprenyl-phosphate phosphoribosyltransferase [Halomonadaceae bacterium]
MNNTAVSRSPLWHLYGLIKLMRPRQWVKNGFVLAPLVFAGEFLNPSSVSSAFLAVLLFCIASSATYIINDTRDIEDDRRHPTKSRTRPLAAGTATVPAAMVLLVLLFIALVVGWFLAPAVVSVILVYMALNLAYSFTLKHQPVLDIFTIAIGFVLRVYAGAVALDVPVSHWMFVTTLCLALYLAAVKRRQEISQSGSNGRKVLGRYSVALIDRYAEMSATGALVFYSMFVMESRPELVITVPLVLFGLFRYWYVVEALDGGESPTDALLSDWQLLVTVGVWAGVCAWSLWPVAVA